MWLTPLLAPLVFLVPVILLIVSFEIKDETISEELGIIALISFPTMLGLYLMANGIGEGLCALSLLFFYIFIRVTVLVGSLLGLTNLS